MLNEILGGRKSLLVASTGGHLAQLHRLTQMSPVHDDSLWITFDTAQSRSLLAGKRVKYVEYVPPRGYWQMAKAVSSIRQAAKAEQFDTLVSTGAGIAASSHIPAALSGEHPVYIESVSRVDGPSATGRLLERIPGVRRYAQHSWGKTRRGWTQEFSVLDTFAPSSPPSGHIRRVFITMGTIAPYEFNALVETVERWADPHTELVWQLGTTSRRPTRGSVHDYMPAETFASNVEWADLVITHAGVGTLISLVESGARVIAVPRRKRRSEHVDDHQVQIAREFSDRGLIVYSELDNLPALIKALA